MIVPYPYDEFERDFRAISLCADEPGIRAYAWKVYPNSGVALDRSVTLQMVCSFINRNLDVINVGKIAVTSESSGCLISNALLKAIHALVIPHCLGKPGEFPSITEVISLAETYVS